MSGRLDIACSMCVWLYEVDEEELLEMKKQGFPEQRYWCSVDPVLELTRLDRYCSRFICTCGGDWQDGENHLECLDVEF